MSRITIPKPELGDTFVRRPGGYTESAMVIGLRENTGGVWTATLCAPTLGTSDVTAQPEGTHGTFTNASWVPKDWIFYQSCHVWGPKGLIYVGTRQVVMHPDQMEWNLFSAPVKDEHYKTWESRVHDEMGEDFWKWTGAEALMKRAWATYSGKPAPKE